jgi:hypothetical protein
VGVAALCNRVRELLEFLVTPKNPREQCLLTRGAPCQLSRAVHAVSRDECCFPCKAALQTADWIAAGMTGTPGDALLAGTGLSSSQGHHRPSWKLPASW